MKKIDHGLGAVGLIALFSLLAWLLATALPIVKSKGGLDAADWLGFSGNVVASLVAIGAAAAAWMVAQRQINSAQQQNAVVAYGALCAILETIAEDRRLAVQLRGIASEMAHTITAWATNLVAPPHLDTIAQLRSTIDRFHADKLAFDTHAGKHWGTSASADIRRAVTEAANVCASNLAIAISGIEALSKLGFTGLERKAIREKFPEYQKELDQLVKLCVLLQVEANREEKMVRGKIAQNYERFAAT